ncbi:MAG TPA: serine hydrolase domain-containing protein [Thermoanaerobaculia bacterium]|nr:serine hydrolase domain-containing protein [Thermoanaerobaculia bacterium]
MKRLLLVLLLAAPAFAQDNIDKIFADYKADTPGCVVGVARGGKITFERGYGSANLEFDIPLTGQSILEAGSVSKQFTAAAVMLLAKDGKLSVDDKARKYLPELPDSAADVTIRELLNHTNGIRDWGDVVALGGWPRGTRVMTQARILDVLSRQRELNFAPGTEWSYNTGGYNLLAMIVERVSGKSFADFTRERILTPTGMTHSSWHDDMTRIVKGRASAYDKEKDGYHIDDDIESIVGNCCLLTTVGDLLRWNINGAELQKPLETPSKLTSGITTDYGFGLFIRDNEIYHSGATAGYRAFLTHFLKEDVSIALLCNRGDAPTGSLVDRVADVVLNRTPQPQPPAAPVRPELLGLYRDPQTNAIMRITERNGAMHIDHGPVLSLVEGDRYRISPKVEVHFEKTLMHLMTIYKPMTAYVRVRPASPTPAQLAEYTGRFSSSEADATWMFSVVDGKLTATILPATKINLTPTFVDGFETEDGDLITFTRDADRHINGFDAKVDFVMPLGEARVERMHFTLVR